MNKDSRRINKIIQYGLKKCPFLSEFPDMGISQIKHLLYRLGHMCPFLRKAELTEIVDEIPQDGKATNYDDIFNAKIKEKLANHSYRIFNRIGRLASEFTRAEAYPTNKDLLNDSYDIKHVDVWCSNDYLGMSRHPKVCENARYVISKHGVGSGGTRNISGNNILHERLEQTLSEWYKKEAGLIFTSCYVANSTTLSTLGRMLEGCVIFSDQGNHASLIEGIRFSNCKKHIYRHNDISDLEKCLSLYPKHVPKVVVFESVNSMNGSLSPVGKICDIAHKHGAITFLDEVHAVGLYGRYGSGYSEQLDVLDKVDIISGTLGKAVGAVGGFIVGKANLVDMIRSYGPGFIFTTSLPPCIISSSIESIKILQSIEGMELRARHQENVTNVRRRLTRLGIPQLPSHSHIVPVYVGDSSLCNKLSMALLRDHGIYVQPINYPTVNWGTERLRIAPTPGHSVESIDKLIGCLSQAWETIGLKRSHPKCSNNSCKCLNSCSSFATNYQAKFQSMI